MKTNFIRNTAALLLIIISLNLHIGCKEKDLSKEKDLFSLYLGYQGYGIDYEKDNFNLDLTLAGIITGFNFNF